MADYRRQANLPDNFYSLVAKKRIRAEKEEAKATLPGKTELLFYEASLRSEIPGPGAGCD